MNPMRRSSPRKFIIVDDNTIQEMEDHEAQRFKKRQRTELESGNPLDSAPRRSTDTQAPTSGFNFRYSVPSEKDPVYFSKDEKAQCYIKVEGVLFKTYESLLSCSTIIQQLLENHIEKFGKMDAESPLVLMLPTLAEFRAFLWVLIATEDELNEPIQEHKAVERLFLIASMTDKYESPKLRAWVVNAIYQAATNPVLLESCSSANLAYMVNECIAQKFNEALIAVVKKWSDRLEKKDAPTVPAIQAADKHGLNDLKGIAYYLHVQDMIDRQTTTRRGATHLKADPKLNKAQVSRLLNGHWSLVSMWEKLRLKPIELPRSSTCTEEGHVKCAAHWERRWISAVGWKRIMGISSADILALLACLRDQLMNDDELKAAGAIEPECRLAGLEALKNFRLKTRGELADHFVGL